MILSNTELLPPAKEVWGKVMFLHLSVCSQGGLHPGGAAFRGGSASKEGVSASRVLGRTPLGILRDTVNERAVSILLECILVLVLVSPK